MNLLELIAICCATTTLAGSVSQLLPAAIRASIWTELAVPIAMLGATSGIALGLLGDGPLWMVGGTILLTIASDAALTFRSFEALFTSGHAATTPDFSMQRTILSVVASAAASLVFAIA